jgi:16S rRNA (guanine527-N7)-methyltransferase
MKGPGAAAETAEAARAVRLLGGELERTEEFELPQTDMGRTIVIIRKRRDTPGAYPRINAQIIKDPL